MLTFHIMIRPVRCINLLRFNTLKTHQHLVSLRGFHNIQGNRNVKNWLLKKPTVLRISGIRHEVSRQDYYKERRMDEADENMGIIKNLAISTAALLTGLALYIVYDSNVIPDTIKKYFFKKKIEDFVPLKFPADSADIPTKIPYLLIGGGTASFSAFRAIKSTDPRAKVLIVSNEPYYPYMRTPLSKEIWFEDDNEVLQKLNFKQWFGTERSVFYEPEDFYLQCKDLENEPKGGVAVARGWTVTKLDPNARKAVLDNGHEIEYEKCLIATGVTPKSLPVFESVELKDKVTLYKSIDDFKRLHETVTSGAKKIAIIGGSFLGTELACSLSKNGTSELKVYQVFPEKGNLSKLLPAYLSSWTTEKIRDQKIDVITGDDVIDACLYKDKEVLLTLKNGRYLAVDHVVVAMGSEPNVQLAESSGLELDPDLGGFLVNSELCARTNLYVAGDCACFYDVHLGRRRVEHYDHAIVSGRLAGENMAGAGKIYSHQSMFWSDLGPQITFEAIGIIDSDLPTVAVYAKVSEESSLSQEEENQQKETQSNPTPNVKTSLPKEGEDYSRGVIFYLRDGLIVGIVLWNVFNGMQTARQVLKERRKFEDLNEVAKLFNIHNIKDTDNDSQQDL